MTAHIHMTQQSIDTTIAWALDVLQSDEVRAAAIQVLVEAERGRPDVIDALAQIQDPVGMILRHEARARAFAQPGAEIITATPSIGNYGHLFADMQAGQRDNRLLLAIMAVAGLMMGALTVLDPLPMLAGALQ